jgi:hypothetical protein
VAQSVVSIHKDHIKPYEDIRFPRMVNALTCKKMLVVKRRGGCGVRCRESAMLA